MIRGVKDLQDLKDLPVHKVLPERVVRAVVIKMIVVVQALRVQKVILDPKDLRAILVHKVQKVIPDLKDLLE